MESKRLVICLTILVTVALACAVPGASTPSAVPEVLTDTPAPATASPSPAATTPAPVALAAAKCMPGVMAQPEVTMPPSAAPSFSRAIEFATTADPSKASYGFYQYYQETKQIYAIWTYANMAAGLTLRRELYRDNALVDTRQELWDFDQCAASGTIIEVAISDPLNGVPNGSYKLRLYINGEPQFTTSDVPRFDMLPAGT